MSVCDERANLSYYLDGICPKWPNLMKTFLYPLDKRWKLQESLRICKNDVERTFGLLKAKWGIIHRSTRAHKCDKIKNEMYVCCILHNMNLKDKGKTFSPVQIGDPPANAVVNFNIVRPLKDTDMNHRLWFDLVEHNDSLQNVVFFNFLNCFLMFLLAFLHFYYLSDFFNLIYICNVYFY